MAQTYDVVIKGTGMGIGEQALIDNLMNGFIHTLAQRENLPAHIIFYGGKINQIIIWELCFSRDKWFCKGENDDITK